MLEIIAGNRLAAIKCFVSFQQRREPDFHVLRKMQSQGDNNLPALTPYFSSNSL